MLSCILESAETVVSETGVVATARDGHRQAMHAYALAVRRMLSCILESTEMLVRESGVIVTAHGQRR